MNKLEKMLESLPQGIKDCQGITNKLALSIDYESNISNERTILLQSAYISFTYESLIRIACYCLFTTIIFGTHRLYFNVEYRY